MDRETRRVVHGSNGNGLRDGGQEAMDTGLWALSGVERRLEPVVEKGSKEKKLRMGLQGRFTIALLGIVMVIIVLVAV